MIKAGCDVNIITNNNKCALLEAIKIKNVDLSENLLKYNANIFHKDP